ncbi:MAG TPA: hypothetical protein H9681_00280 [Firmicutes bacterium]|nr:hypothetical protein [Bacillota bacterium]
MKRSLYIYAGILILHAMNMCVNFYIVWQLNIRKSYDPPEGWFERADRRMFIASALVLTVTAIYLLVMCRSERWLCLYPAALTFVSGVSLISARFEWSTPLQLLIDFIGALPVGALGFIDRGHEYELSLVYYAVLTLLVVCVMLVRRRGRE